MAKQVEMITLKIIYNPVSGLKVLRDGCVCVQDDVNTDLQKMNKINKRPLTNDELTGTLQAFLDGIKSQVESDEGIV